MKYYFLFVFLSFISCGPKVIYDEEVIILGKWSYDKPVTFNYEISDTSKAYNLIMEIEHQNNFSYENLYVNATTFFPDNHKLSTPFSLQLSNNNGDWVGSCTSQTCRVEIEISSKAFYKLKGDYKLLFEQHSRNDSLIGINSIGIKIAEAE